MTGNGGVGGALKGAGGIDLSAEECKEFAEKLRTLENTMKRHMAILSAKKSGVFGGGGGGGGSGNFLMAADAAEGGKDGGQNALSIAVPLTPARNAKRRESTKPTDNVEQTRAEKVYIYLYLLTPSLTFLIF